MLMEILSIDLCHKHGSIASTAIKYEYRVENHTVRLVFSVQYEYNQTGSFTISW